MISILITAYREPTTVGKAIEAFLAQLPEDAELLVVAPDPETTAVVEEYARRYPVVRHVLDPQRGKPTALNFGLQAARGEIIVFSDGDVVVETHLAIVYALRGDWGKLTRLAAYLERRQEKP